MKARACLQLFVLPCALLFVSCAHETIGRTPRSSVAQSSMTNPRYPYQRLGSADPDGPLEPR